MRIRVRVMAPVERLGYARRTSRFQVRTGAQPEIALRRFFLKREIWIWHRDGVVHRLNGGANSRAPVQPVNNAGQAIQVSKPAVSPISNRQSRRQCRGFGDGEASAGWKPAIQQIWKSALRRGRQIEIANWRVGSPTQIGPTPRPGVNFANKSALESFLLIV